MQRVLRRGGGVYFEVEYHAPTVMEPITLSGARVVEAFPGCELQMVVSRTAREMFEALVKRFDLVPNQFQHFGEQPYVTWGGMRR